jgi:NADH:ubiquinone oxidoreductase subunit 4 (subunit M)
MILLLMTFYYKCLFTIVIYCQNSIIIEKRIIYFISTIQQLLFYNIPFPNNSKHLRLGFFLSFAVKVPIIPFHIWLPEAHVEASLAGSIILAGVLLKLAGYGFLRYSIAILSYFSFNYPFMYKIPFFIV